MEKPQGFSVSIIESGMIKVNMNIDVEKISFQQIAMINTALDRIKSLLLEDLQFIKVEAEAGKSDREFTEVIKPEAKINIVEEQP